MAARTQFTFYDSFYRSISRIKKKADRADAYDAVVAYALLGQEPDLDKLPDAAAIAFEVIRPNLDASRRKSEAGKQGGRPKKQNESTAKATESTGKANDSTGKANRKQEQEKEQVKEQDKDKDKEQMLYPPLPPNGGTAPPDPEPEVNLSALSPTMQAKLQQWLAYKRERRESYKTVGLQTLVNKIRSSVDKYGEYAVCEVIDISIASGYQGIIFDRLQQRSGRKEPPAAQPSLGSLEMEAIQRMMRGGEG